MLHLERALDMPGEALPSFHVIWAMLAAGALGRAAAVWAAFVAFSCVMNGMHSIADVAAGSVAGLLLLRADRAWEFLRGTTERIANSWHEWRAGPFRFINHGVYAGLATFVCLAIVSALAGPRHVWIVAATALAGLLGAGLWAQWVEGSPRLLRPFGFYGGLLGVTAVACLAPDRWLILAAYCAAAPWLQAIGRLRCLVQGCCHGGPADPAIGIRYRDPHSRVTRVPGLAGIPIHPTPLYSILANAVAALVLARLWNIGAPLHAIAGVYLILTGLARFVEEAYRGEPQTPALAGLHLYQWIAVASVVAGASITAIARSAPAPTPHFTWTGIALAAFFGVLSALALGADSPESTRRFGRLT
jgi:prolipoprotein diacylglyceryltransferase